jgi:hypothetical protein
VVIVGGGFGGVAAAQHLKRADVDVTIVERNSHRLFQRDLQLAAGALSSREVAAPIREIVERRQGIHDRGDGLDYDSLILACGGETSSFGHHEWHVVGSGGTVCEVRGHWLAGLPPFLKYFGVPLHYLGRIGGRRITALAMRLSAAFGARRNRVIEGRLGSVERPAPAAPEPKAMETVDGRRA